MAPVFGLIGGMGATELLLILVIVLVLFGAGRLPQVFESFGKGIKAFRDGQKDDTIDVTRPPSETPKVLTEDPVSEAKEVAIEKERQRNG